MYTVGGNMAYIKNKPRHSYKTGVNTVPLALDGGVNRDGTVFNIAKNEAWDCRNTSCKNGALTVKEGDTEVFTKLSDEGESISTFPCSMSIGSAGLNNHLDVIIYSPDDIGIYKRVKYRPGYGIDVSGFPSPLDYNIVSSTLFKTETEKYTIYALTDGDIFETHGSTFNILVDAPSTLLYTVDDYRLYALKYNTLYCCDPTDVTNWTTGDSDQILISDMIGLGTALIAFNDVVVAFSDQTMHFFYGDDTSNFSQGQSLPHGCVGLNALAKTEDTLYFLDFGKLKMYRGGVVTDISEKISYWLKDMNTTKIGDYHMAVVGINDRYVYLSIPYGESTANNMTFEYDTKTGIWQVWDEGFSHFVKFGNKFYGAKTTGIYEIGNATTLSTTSWYHETPMEFVGFNKQILTSLPILVDLPIGSTLKLAYNTNANVPSWTDLFTFTPNANVQNQLIYVPLSVLNNVDYYQLKFYGTGPCSIHYVGDDGRVRVR